MHNNFTMQPGGGGEVAPTLNPSLVYIVNSRTGSKVTEKHQKTKQKIILTRFISIISTKLHHEAENTYNLCPQYSVNATD